MTDKMCVIPLCVFTISVLTAITLGGAYDREGASPIQLGHVICCSGRREAAAARAKLAVTRARYVCLTQPRGTAERKRGKGKQWGMDGERDTLKREI